MLRALVLACSIPVVGAPAATAARPRLEQYMAVLGIALGSSTMSTAIRHFRGGCVVHNGGDAGASKLHLCYRGADNTALVFSCWAGCRLDRNEGALPADEYWLAASVGLVDFGSSDPSNFDPSCTPARELSSETAIGSLRLGMTRAAVVQALGAPATETGGRLEYVDGKRHLAVAVEAGKVVSIHAARWWE